MNYRIVDLANLVKKFLPDSKILINSANVDNRSYRVNFSKFKSLFSGYKNMKGAKYSIAKLIYMLKKRNFKNKDFRSSNFMRLISLKNQNEKKNLLSQRGAILHWIFLEKAASCHVLFFILVLKIRRNTQYITKKMCALE